MDLTSELTTTLTLRDIAAKGEAVRRLWQLREGLTPPTADFCPPVHSPGYPPALRLLPPAQVPQRNLNTLKGRVGLLHAIAHIEFNAIHLALDAVYRFGGMPRTFYQDWLQVALEEMRHFEMLRQRLQDLGADYGDLPAHNGLWEAAEKTAHDVLVRMALVPRVLEARGLDVTPGMIARLEKVGDLETVAVLNIILREEIGHVAIGSRWFHYLCAQRQCEPFSTFRRLLREYRMQVRPPLNEAARLQSGFTTEELSALLAMSLPEPSS